MDDKLDKLVRSYIHQSPFVKAFGENPEGLFDVDGISSYPLSFLVRELKSLAKGRLFVVFPTEDGVKDLAIDLAGDEDVAIYPGSGKSLYCCYSQTREEWKERETLERIRDGKAKVVVLSLRSLLSPCMDSKMLDDVSMKVRKGDPYDPEALFSRLVSSGYSRTPSCYDEGTFALRGEVVDIYPFSSQSPIRIYAEWDKIEGIYEFDPFTQKRGREIGAFTLSSSLPSGSGEFEAHFDSYVQASDTFMLVGSDRMKVSHESLKKEAEARYKEEYRVRENVKSPMEVLLDREKFFRSRKSLVTIHDIRKDDAYHYSVSPSRSYFGNVTYFKEDASSLIRNDWKVFVISPSLVQKERLDSVLSSLDVGIMVKEISSGFAIDDEKIQVSLDQEIFGRKRKKAERFSKIESEPLDSFVELKEGDYVVHVNYGIGEFEKIERVKAFDTERDYIKIKYLNDERLYVPIEQANLVQKYIGSEGKPPKLDSMGSSSWTKKKEKARKSAEKLASELVHLYAERENSEGFPFEKDDEMQLSFEASFPFQETPDQTKCLEEIKKDMESKKVMDRLVCGDVGYGKTELAFRAAFKAALSGKQVAFLAPTVILAEQHYNNFKERLGDIPVNIALLTRFTTQKESTRIKKELESGGIEVLFGTHRMLRNTKFKNLGLLIVDEEQRFGVKDKERIKKMKTNVDCLTLSATPIPRTLYMSLLHVRDMSLLTTAPRERLPVETYIGKYDFSLVVDAIKKELGRGGQVFYLHNRIDDLEDIQRELSSAIPSAIIEYAHGQMDSDELEDRMHRFVYEGVQVLVSTTIIENGIDIPNVNTMIIDRADRLGLSQLYQLRGRVGRSDKKAYCYLFYPSDTELGEDALKRLKAMSENTALGSGFKIAMKDMEMRGTGNILGREQSGHLEAVGLDMYLKLLGEEVERIRSEGKSVEKEVLLELDYTGFIPDSYIDDPGLKFELYKKIATARGKDVIENLRGEISDRFGAMPEEVDNLFCIAEIKTLLKDLDIYHAYEKNGEITFELDKVATINLSKLVSLVTLSGGRVRISPTSDKIIMKVGNVGLKDKALFILEELRRLL